MGGWKWVAGNGWQQMGGSKWVAANGWRQMGGGKWVAANGWQELGGGKWVARFTYSFHSFVPFLSMSMSLQPLLKLSSHFPLSIL